MARDGERPAEETNPTRVVDPTHPLAFEFDGRPAGGYQGDTVASALYRAGITVFSRSFKYHRPRGLLCVAGRCPNCLVTVDGVPNVRACTERLRDGMSVRHQNAWPSLERDALSVLDKLGLLMPVGFYYKTFHRPKLFWRLAQPVIRRIAGLGSLETESVPDRRYRHQNLHTDVAVVGGGAAGMSAALAAAAGGVKVTLIDDQPSLGGGLRYDPRAYQVSASSDRRPGYEIVREMDASVRAATTVDVIAEATAFGAYEDNLLGVLDGDRLVKLRARRVVLATGAYEVPAIFDRNDLPGAMLTTAAQRLLHLYGVVPGATAVVATDDDDGYYAAAEMLRAGVRITAVVDRRPEFPHDLEPADAMRSQGILLLPSHAVVRAEGRKRVTAAVVTRLEGGVPTGDERRLACDVVCASGGFRPADGLLHQAGGSSGYDSNLGESVPSLVPPNWHVAGEVTGIHDLGVAVLQGKLAGLRGAASLGPDSSASPEVERLDAELATAEAAYRGRRSHVAAPARGGDGAREFVCFCEDVTVRDITNAVDEGFRDIQTLKRYSTVTMGPCQGKMCLKSFIGVAAGKTGQSIDEVGVTTQRPPLEPVSLAALAGPAHIPIKRTPMDRKHRDLGAPMVDLGPWQRAYSYGSPQEECIAVRQRVGMIDVSTLGKLDVRGPDAPALLDKVYTHHFGNLRVGRIRYGVLCSDNGTILDDGTVTRLAEDHYLVTTTTGNTDLIEEWFKWWMAGTEMCAHVTNVTAALAAINVAGPRARETLAKLTDLDLSPKAFRYMRSGRGQVAGVEAILLRIGFVGETGWEVHFPAEYGEYMWDAVMQAGAEFGIAPFGLEAQRILRLEKKHIIVGQDTDAVTTPLESDLGWAVRFDKDDFIGRGALAAAGERGMRDKLVGFTMRDGGVPDDGDPVVANETPVGRVSSARLSPTMGKGFGLAWVPVDLAEDGSEIYIRIDGRDVPADVRMEPVYDPEGERLRE